MASNSRRISYNEVTKHPEDSILLAYLRGQELEARSSVIQHIEDGKCSVCLQKLHELKRVSTTLDVLGEMRPYQYYPELSVADTYARMQNAVSHQITAKATMNGAYHRNRPRKSALRWISVPVAFGLAIFFIMAMLVYAAFSGRALLPFSATGGTSHVQNTLTIVVPPQVATAIVTPNGASETKGPHIKVCSTRNDITQMLLVICGFNFDSKHKVTLTLYGFNKEDYTTRAIHVDKHGKFHVEWALAACSNVPTLVVGYEYTGSKPIKVKLQIKSFGSCPKPTNTAVAKSTGFSSNFVPQVYKEDY
jgi:hypothetical protein